MKKTLNWVVLIGVIMMLGELAYAQDSNEHHQMMQMPKDEQKQVDLGTSEKSSNVGNAICPVSGEVIDPAAKVTYEYEGKIYNFCCADCVDDFKKDPEPYIKKVENELKNESGEKSK